MAWAEDPPSRTRHLIGNLEVAALENGEVQAKTALLVYRSNQIAWAMITLCGPPSGRLSALCQAVSRNHASASASP